MSYTAPTSWTSNGMNWSTEPFVRPLSLSYVEAIRLALIERIDAARLPRTPPVANEVYGQPAIGHTTKPFAMFYQDLVDRLLPIYANHNDEANWHGSTENDGPKAWTESDMMSHLGQTRIIPAEASPLDGAWIKQQYEILNQLRWTKESATVSPTPWSAPAGAAESQGSASGESSWSDAKSSASADYSSASPGGAPGGYSYGFQTAESPDEFSANLLGRRGAFHVSVPEDFEADVDFYFYPDKPSIFGIDPADVEADSFGEFTYFAKWNLLGTTNASKGTPGNVQDVVSPLIGTVTQPSWPVADPTFGTPTARGWSLFSGASLWGVAKWDQDATNGFQFID